MRSLGIFEHTCRVEPHGYLGLSVLPTDKKMSPRWVGLIGLRNGDVVGYGRELWGYYREIKCEVQLGSLGIFEHTGCSEPHG